ncbi:MAG: alpha/beta fold hydrolase [Candidatus Hodarchaeales archaeon]|jgi:pimeloyl-ACP methyl ester carboxylesterase
MSQWKTDYISTNDIKLHYYRTGGDKPPIVLCHGITDNGLCWAPIARRLEKNFDVIMVDAIGHGLSDVPPTGYSVDNMAKDLVGLIEGLKLEKPVVMGHSMGAQYSSRAASLYPDLFGKLILEDPGYGMSFPLPNFIMKRVVKILFKRMLLNPLRNLTVEEMKVKCKKDNPKWSDEEIEPWVESKIQLFSNDPELLFDSFMKSADSTKFMVNLELIKDITCPILLIVPEKGLTKKKIALKLTEEIWKDAQYVEIQNAGHNVRRENLEDFMQAVNTFLKINMLKNKII